MSKNSALPSTLDQVLITSMADYSSQVVDNAYDANTFMSLLKQYKQTIDGGVSIVKPLLDEIQNDGGFFSGADTLNTSQSDTLNSVEYQWQNAYEPIAITLDEERQNAGRDHQLIKLVENKVNRSTLGARRRIEQAMSTPVAGSGDLNDLETIVNTGTLGSINGASEIFWQSTVTASGAFATQGRTDLTTAYYAVSGGEQVDNPTHILTNSTIFQKYEQTLLPFERQTPGGAANSGFDALSFKAKPFMYTNFIQSGLIFGLNMNYINLVVDSELDFATTPFIKANNQQAKVAYIIWRGNLITDNRRRHFKLTGVS